MQHDDALNEAADSAATAAAGGGGDQDDQATWRPPTPLLPNQDFPVLLISPLPGRWAVMGDLGRHFLAHCNDSHQA